MTPVVWLIAVVLAYFALGYWLYLAVDTLQRRRRLHLISLVAIAALAMFILKLDSAGFQWKLLTACSTVVAGSIAHQKLLFNTNSSPQERKRRRALKRQVRLHLVLATGAVVFLMPFVWMLSTSLKPDSESNHYPPEFIPRRPVKVSVDGRQYDLGLMGQDKTKVAIITRAGENRRVRLLDAPDVSQELLVNADEIHEVRKPTLLWNNYAEAIAYLPFEYKNGLVPLLNTLYVTLLSIIGTLLSSSLVAYSFARLRWPGRDVLFVVMLATMMIPGAVTMLPVFLIFRWLGWVDTLRPLWVTSFLGSAFFIFLLRQFFMTIPNDLEDAARIDGCGFFGIYWRIMLPLIKPALAAVTIMTFMATWNNFMGPLIYISSPEKMTVAYALQLFQSMHGANHAMMMAAATIVMLPVLAIFFFTQRYFIQGVTLTGIKG